MKSRTSNRLAAVAILAGCLVVPAISSATDDSEPPAISMTPPARVAADEVLRLEARVVDSTGVANVVAYAKGEHDEAYKRFQMKNEGGDLWVVSLMPSSERGGRVVFYVEAFDDAGNGPSRAGHADVPYIVRTTGEGAGAAGGQGFGVPVGVLVVVALTLALCGFLYGKSKKDARREVRRREIDFWRNLLDPLLDMPEGDAREAAIVKLCGKQHAHPRLGMTSIDASEIKRRLTVMDGGKRRRRPTVGQPQPAAVSRSGNPLRDVEEDIFWFRLLSPLRDMDTLGRDNAMRELGSRPHQHPLKGKHFIDRSTLQQQFLRVRTMSLKKLQARFRELKLASMTPPPAVTQAESVDETQGRAAALPAGPQESTAAMETLPSLDDRDDSQKTVAEEIFWFNLLARARELPEDEQAAAIGALSGQAHNHPLEGNRLFSKKRLYREFAWVKSCDVDTLHERWNKATLSALGHDASLETGAGDEALAAAFGEVADGEGVEDHLDAFFGEPAESATGGDRRS